MTFNTTNWKHRAALLGAIIILATTAWTQEIEWSENYPMNSIFNQNELIQASTDGFYVLENYKDANYYYQQSLSFYTLGFEKREGAKPLAFMEDKLKGTYQFALSKDKTPYVAYSVDRVETQQETLFINALESSTLGLSGQPTKLLEIDYKDKIKPKGGYRYCASPDGSRMLFYGQLPYEKKAKGTLQLLLVDAGLEALGRGVVSLKQEADILTVSDVVDVVIDNDGLVYLLCKLYKGKDKKEEKKLGKRFVYSLIQMDYKAKTKVQILDTLKVLSPQDSAIVVSAKLSVNRTSGAVTCLGTYKLPRKQPGLFSLNAEQAFVEMPVVLDYPAEVLALEAKMPRKIKKKKHLSLKNYKIKSIFEQTDGTQIIVAEQHYINVYWDKSEGRQEQHKLNNLLVAKLVDQKIVWATVLAKRQKAGAEGYTNVPEKLYSFYAFLRKGNIHILYNEMKENLAITDEFQLEKGHYNKPKDCYLVHCKMDLNSGVLNTKESILGLKEAGVAVYPKETKVLEDGSLLFLGVKPEYSLKKLSYIRFGHWDFE
ncbi:MAG: Unknown protein [uncultured Aureispira sp.]|uniref:Uncharacterized protein n=1 Tax=uncultured Aureispira sp. TaxID=1331704 RepID=A0A6S6SSS2_9BACT|nr:MAG: Unknown protein [uncultured Aureispira sp.]